MSSPAREFHFFVDQLSQPFVDDTQHATNGTQSPRLVVPSGVSHLVVPAGQAPRLLEEADREDVSDALLLEPVFSQKQPYLLLVSQPGKDVRINGQVAPRFASLREKDQVQFDDEFMLHLTLFSRPRICDVPDQLVGKECPVCRVPYVAQTRVYLCGNCSSAMHLQGEEEPESTRLECALAITECPVCQTPIEMTEGYRYEPELYSV